MKPPRLALLPALPAAFLLAPFFAGCVSVEETGRFDDTLCAEPADGAILPKAVTRSASAVSCDFGEVIDARPVVEARGPAGAAIKYRTYSDAADAAESVFELPKLSCDERADDLMDRIVLITATHRARRARKFRFLDIEPSDGVEILRTGGMPTSSRASP